MKPFKESKAEGSKQSKGKGAEPQESGALFPRLHVKETNNAGPRAPPRNKMALYEQLTVPASRFVQPSTKPSTPQTAKNISYSGQCSYKSGLALPMYMTPPIPFTAINAGHHSLDPAPMPNLSNEGVDCQVEANTLVNFSHLASSSISLGIATSLATAGHRREKNVTKPEEDNGVPTIISDMVERVSPTDHRMEKDKLSGSQPPGQNVDGGPQMATLIPELDSLQNQSWSQVCTGVPLKSSKAIQGVQQGHADEAGNNESGSQECGLTSGAVIQQSAGTHHSSSQQPHFHDSVNNARFIHGYQVSRGPAPGDIILVARQDYMECRKNSRVAAEDFNAEHLKSPMEENIREVASIHNFREEEISPPSSSNSSVGTGDVENQTDGSGVEVSEPSQLRGEETSDDSDSSMIDLSPLAKVLPKDVIGAVGQHEFWKMRKAIFKQQRIFAMQLFELHRLVKVQEIMGDPPSAPVQEVSDCQPAGISVIPELKSLSLPDITTIEDEEKEIECTDVLKGENLTEVPVLQVPHIPEKAHPTENTQNIHHEQQAQMHAAPFAFPVMPGQPNPWVYAPHLNTGLNYWAGAMAAGPGAYSYQTYRPFPSFYAPIGAYNDPHNQIANVPGPFNVPHIYPLVGYPQHPDIYLNSYSNNCSASNPQWNPFMQSGSPLDATTPSSYPYIPPFGGAGQGSGPDDKGYMSSLAVTKAPPSGGQMVSSGLAGEVPTERLETPSMEASRWNKNPMHLPQDEPYATFYACQQPMYCPPRGFCPTLPSNNAEHIAHAQAGHFRGQNSPESGGYGPPFPSFLGTPNRVVEDTNHGQQQLHEQEQLGKGHREGSLYEKKVPNKEISEMGPDLNLRSKEPNFNPERFSVSPWGSVFHQFDNRKHHMSDRPNERLVKVVPRAMLATPESAAEILHLIQQERQ